MTITAIGGFSAAMLLLAASPGPGVFAVVSRTLSSGFRRSLYMICGIVTGDIIYLIFAISGLTYLSRNMSRLFIIIRILGGLYLIITGIKTALAPLEDTEREKDKGEISRFSAYFSGLLITLSNPKVILFYCGFLPAFVKLNELKFNEAVIIVSLVIIILGSVMALYSRLADSAGNFVHSPPGRKRLNRIAGGVMIAAGTALALKK